MQHGFLAGRSTTTNLLCFTQIINQAVAAGDQVDVIETDLAKAFDKVDFLKLLDRLAELGLPGLMLALLRSYLTKRLNYVIFKGCKSTPYVATSGLPQGSNLGPLLFNIFINRFPNQITRYLGIFADDTKIYLTIRCLSDCIILQQNIDNFVHCCHDNLL